MTREQAERGGGGETGRGSDEQRKLYIMIMTFVIPVRKCWFLPSAQRSAYLPADGPSRAAHHANFLQTRETHPQESQFRLPDALQKGRALPD